MNDYSVEAPQAPTLPYVRWRTDSTTFPCHIPFPQLFETNNWWVALLTFGEGWHDNHHAYPTAARHGLAWYEIDLNWWGIRTLQFLRLAKGIKLVTLAEVSAR